MPDFNVKDITQESGEPSGENATYNIGMREIELHLPKLEDVNHPLVKEVEDDYLIREINGVEDLKLLSFITNDPDYFAMLEGEAAVGKDLSFKVLSSVANWPLLRVNFSIGTTYQSLVGRYAPADTDDTEKETFDRTEAVKRTALRMFEQNEDMTMEKSLELASNAIPSGSSFRWVDGLLTRAVKYGWLFVADEINAAEDEAIMPLNGLTEDRDSRYLTIEEKSEVIEPHPRFRFAATRNPITYSGAGDMNSALESRAYLIKYDYHEAEAIKEIITNKTDILENESEHNLEQLVDLAQDIRMSEQEGTEVFTKVSTRDLIKVGRLTDIMDIESATKTIFSGIADPTDEDSIKGMIRSQNFQNS